MASATIAPIRSIDDHDPLVDPTKTMVLFESLQNIDINSLEGKDLSSVLPILTKLLLSKSFVKKQQLFKLLYPIREMNDVIQLMLSKSIELCETAYLPQESSFELVDCNNKLRLVAAEYINIHGRARQSTLNSNFKLLHSNLFDNPLYIDYISYCLCMLPLKSNNSIMNVFDMVETLLHVKYGTTFIIRLVANMPEYCLEISQTLVNNGERLDEGSNEISEQRAKALRLICNMNSSIAFTVRSMTLQACKVPSLTVMITLDQLTETLDKYKSLTENDGDQSSGEGMELEIDQKELAASLRELENKYDHTIALITGILMGVDDGNRVWFSQFIKAAQQKRIDQNNSTVLTKLRSLLLEYMNILFPSFIDDEEREEGANNSPKKSHNDNVVANRKLIRATATLRLYCALRGVGSLKLSPEECDILLRIITCKPAASQTSVNFATTGVCTLLVCSALLGSSKEEKRATEWLKWLVKESNYSDSKFTSSDQRSISKLLLLIATHFHHNQNNQIAELICATLGTELQIKASISKCKYLFVQDIFDEQIITKQAAEVPVAKSLEHDVTEFVSVHCINQLLEGESWFGQPSLFKQAKCDLMSELERGFKILDQDHRPAIMALRSVCSLRKEEIWQFVDIFIANFSRIMNLDGNLNPEHSVLVQLASKLWWKFNTFDPKTLWVMTVNALRRQQNSSRVGYEMKSFEYSWDELVLDPLIVLKCDCRVFRCLESLNIVLHILSAFLADSRRFLQDRIDKLSANQKDVRNLEELKTTLILAQTSAAIQILLESCLPNDLEREALNERAIRPLVLEHDSEKRLILDKYDKSVNCICEHLHQVFIADTNLAKLVHFQTYPSELLALTADKIPSMHICLDFIPELLSQPDISKQVFVIELTSHLCEKYAITKSLNVAKLCFNVSFTMLQLLPSERRAMFFIPVLPALLRIRNVFPILKEDADLILHQIEQITLAHMAATSSRLSLNSGKPFNGLDKISWREAKNMMQKLDLHESLYLCIQKVLASCQ